MERDSPQNIPHCWIAGVYILSPDDLRRYYKPFAARNCPAFACSGPATLNVALLPIQPFLRTLCKSLYSEDLLVKLPQIAALGMWGMNVNGQQVLSADAEANEDTMLEQMLPPRRAIPTGHQQRFKELLAAEQAARPADPVPSHYAAAAFRFAGGTIPQMPYAGGWSLRHLYDGTFDHYDEEHFYGAGQQRINALQDHRHFTQAAGMVAVHPVVNQLWPIYPWIVYTLRARAAVTLHYDPDRVFFEHGERDACGFVV